MSRTDSSQFKRTSNGGSITNEMLTIQQVKTILNNPNISDEEAIEIRDNFRSLAEVIFEQWEKEKEIKK